MHAQIAPSMMCVDFLALAPTLSAFKAANIEYLHIDVMDGQFVPNYTLGGDFCQCLKKASPIPLDIHLMILEPERKLDWFPFGPGDLVSVHAETSAHPRRALESIRARGAGAMLALSPMTPVDTLRHAIDLLDAVLIMTVNPGFAGQKLIPSMLDKITETRRFLDQHDGAHIPIEVDGNVSFENARRMRDAGADIFVAGSSSIFAPGAPLAERIRAFRAAIA